ncbi:hypothetical protein FHS39_001202 [Streptomyces olivoverticillatus]|uniref:Uncharacterized protein n=1 Tax=Streptomyces olivoverticillatus TaxID=66427 RepID=A0A7W7PIM4_9ACTN|nr:hypothetical protein [Streptomyces olivoverticillatus]MBB4892191.1 hypothetical protein [Streptomyces olivoverticillatus]
MTDRAEPLRRARMRTVVAIFAGVAVLVVAGVWLGRAADRASVVDEAPKTAAAQKARTGQAAQDSVDESVSRELPGVRDCGVGEPVLEPTIINLDCANSGRVASGIQWDDYAADGAAGSGVVQVGGANGAAQKSFPVRLKLFGAKNVDGLMAFTALEVTYTGATPTGRSTEMYSIA